MSNNSDLEFTDYHIIIDSEILEQPSTDKELEEFEKMVDDIYDDLVFHIKKIRVIKNKIPKIKTMYRKIYNKTKITKNVKKEKSKTLAGFHRQEPVPKDIADFLGIEYGTSMNRVAVCSLITQELKKRKLVYAENGQVYRADKEIKNLFDLPDNVNDQINPRHPDSLSIFTIHSYIAVCYKREKINNKKQKSKSIKKAT